MYILYWSECYAVVLISCVWKGLHIPLTLVLSVSTFRLTFFNFLPLASLNNSALLRIWFASRFRTQMTFSRPFTIVNHRTRSGYSRRPVL